MNPRKLMTYLAKTAALSLAFVGLQALPAAASDYGIDCAAGTITGATFTEQPPNSNQFIADVYLDGRTTHEKTVDVANCEYGSARNAYGDDPKPGSGVLNGAGITYYVQVAPNTYGDVWGYNVWSGGSQAGKTYIIQFWNYPPSVYLSEEPFDGGTTSAVDSNSDGTFELTATPNSGFSFTSWSCNNDQTPTSTSNASTTITPGRDTTCTATFTADPDDPGDPDAEISLTSSVDTVGPGDTVAFETDAYPGLLAAIFINGELPEYGYGPVGLLSEIGWESFPVCEDSTFTVRIYDTEEYDAPSFSDSYSATIEVSWLGDQNDPSCEPEIAGPVTKKVKFKPSSPIVNDIVVSKGSGALNIGATYSGKSDSKPSTYTVKVSPGGNTCVITGASSSCEVVGLKVGVEYTISIAATNKFGTSAETVLPSKYILTEAGLLGYVSKKAILGFAGGSAKLTKTFKAEIKKFIITNSGLTAITCTGYTAGKPVVKSDKVLAKNRASNVCAYIEKIKPSVSTTTIGKTPGLPWGPANRKVVIRGYSAISQ